MPSKNTLWISGIFLIIISFNFYFSLSHFNHSVFNDLKTRVVGSRLATENKNAYFHKFDPAIDSIYLLDPFEKTAQIVNGNTVTPMVLMSFSGLHQLPQYKINAIWFFINYLAFFTILFIFYRYNQKKYTNQRKWLLLFSVLLLGIVGWRMHLLSGQIYILYSLLAILSVHFHNTNKIVLAALFAAFVTAMRFPYGLLFLPFLVFNKKFLVYYLLFLGISIFSTFIFYSPSIWLDYFHSMQIHGLENAGTIPELSHPKNFELPKYIERSPTFASEKLLEYVRLLDADIFSVQKFLIHQKLKSNSFILGILLLLSSLVLFFLFGKKHLFSKKENLLLFCSILLFVSDYFLPTLRFNYNFVQFLIPLFVLHIYNIQLNLISKVLMTAGILLNIFKLNWIPECYSVGEILCITGIIICLKNNK